MSWSDQLLINYILTPYEKFVIFGISTQYLKVLCVMGLLYE